MYNSNSYTIQLDKDFEAEELREYEPIDNMEYVIINSFYKQTIQYAKDPDGKLNSIREMDFDYEILRLKYGKASVKYNRKDCIILFVFFEPGSKIACYFIQDT